MFIRVYKENDFDSINSINKLSHIVPSPAGILKAEAEQGKTWVAEVNEIVAGFLVGKLKHDIPYIYNISVEETYRKQGIASKLIEEFEDYYGKFQLKGNKCFWLQVDSNNPAQKLYFDLGYRAEMIDEDFYGKGKNAICMYKRVKVCQ